MKTLVGGQVVAHDNVLSPFTHFNLGLKRRYEFLIGKTEIHKVVIEKQRPLLLAGFRPNTYRVFVDGQLVHEQSGY